MSDTVEHRAFCFTCRRPKMVCWCGALKPMHSPTRVVFVQHPRESRVPISTCRMAHLSLPNSELHVSLTGDQLDLPPGAAVLFPSDEAIDVKELDRPPATLVVVDGTWSNAKKVVNRSAKLRALPRISLNPDRPGNYRIRKEPKPNCLSTIEAVALVLGLFEGEPEKFQPILSVFDRMVETQLDHIGKGPPRHARFRHRNKHVDLLQPLRDAWPRLVIAYGEGNGMPSTSGDRVRPELIQLVAIKPATGERFEQVLKPRRALAPRIGFHLDLTDDQIQAGASVNDALKRWREFVAVQPSSSEVPGHAGVNVPVPGVTVDGPGLSRDRNAVIATWGGFTLDLLEVEGAKPADTLNLKHLASQHAYRSTGGIEKFAAELGHLAPIQGKGRAGRRIAALEHIARSLVTANNS